MKYAITNQNKAILKWTLGQRLLPMTEGHFIMIKGQFIMKI